MKCILKALWLLTTVFAVRVGAGGGAMQTLVIVNNNETQSLEIGRYYADARGIPENHILHLDVPFDPVISLGVYGATVLAPALDYLDTHGLADQISTFVFTFRRPYRVWTSGKENGLTSTFYYGFKDYSLATPCDLAAVALNEYAGTETSFEPANTNGYRLSAILTLDTLAEAQTVIDRSVSADFSVPGGNAYYLYTSDAARNVRWPQFDEAQFMQGLVQPTVQVEFRFADFIVSESNVLACVTGLPQPPFIDSNTYVPGALADHLTSYGGLIDPAPSQTSAQEWLRAGCVGSYGTVVEPCNFTNKFPAALTHYYYARGFSMGESYYQGLSHPYQGIVLGDPLCQPYAIPLVVSVLGGVNPVVSGNLDLNISAASTEAQRWVDRIELYIDGLLHGTVTNIVPAVGNIVEATVNGTTRGYTVQTNDDLADIAAGLQAALALPPGLGVDAESHADRLLLKQQALGVPGAGIAYSAEAKIGSATRQTIQVQALSGTLFETPVRARQALRVEGNPSFGHSLFAAIKRLDGLVFTHVVSRLPGDTRLDMVTRLMDAINTDTNLQIPEGCTARALVNDESEDSAEFQLFANTNTWESATLEVHFDVTGFGFADTDYNGTFGSNAAQMAARGLLSLTRGQPVLNALYSLDTTGLADGPHAMSIVAYEGSAVHTQGQTNFTVVVDNHGMSCDVVWPPAGQTFIRHHLLSTELAAVTPAGVITSLVLFVEGKAQPAQVFDTGAYPSGPLSLYAEAQNSAGEKVRSDPVLVVLLENEDADGLADDWEILHFGDTSSWAGTNDVDNDTLDNAYEFVTDTDPNDPLSFFSLSIAFDAPVPQVGLRFPTSTQRLYQIEVEDDLVNGDWSTLLPASIPGSGSVTNFFEPVLIPLRNYRMRISLP